MPLCEDQIQIENCTSPVSTFSHPEAEKVEVWCEDGEYFYFFVPVEHANGPVIDLMYKAHEAGHQRGVKVGRRQKALEIQRALTPDPITD